MFILKNFADAADLQAILKTFSGLYNWGIWSYLVDDLFFEQRTECAEAADLFKCFESDSYEIDYV